MKINDLAVLGVVGFLAYELFFKDKTIAGVTSTPRSQEEIYEDFINKSAIGPFMPPYGSGSPSVGGVLDHYTAEWQANMSTGMRNIFMDIFSKL